MAGTDESQPDDTIQDLQRDKLLLELGLLRRPFWHSSGFLGVVAATILAIATLSTGYLTGYFDVESKRLELDRSQLREDVNDFTVRKRVLEDSLTCLDSLFDVVLDSVVTLEDAREGLLVILESQTDSLETREIALAELRDDLLGIEEKRLSLERSVQSLGDSIKSTGRIVHQLTSTKDSLFEEISRQSRVYDLRYGQMDDSLKKYKSLAEDSRSTDTNQAMYELVADAYADTLSRLRMWDSTYQEWYRARLVSDLFYLVRDHHAAEQGMPVVFASSAIATYGTGLITGVNLGDSIGVLHIAVARRSDLGELAREREVRIDSRSILKWSDNEIRLSLSDSALSILPKPRQLIPKEPITSERLYRELYTVLMVETADGRESRWHSVLHGDFWLPRR